MCSFEEYGRDISVLSTSTNFEVYCSIVIVLVQYVYPRYSFFLFQHFVLCSPYNCVIRTCIFLQSCRHFAHKKCQFYNITVLHIRSCHTGMQIKKERENRKRSKSKFCYNLYFHSVIGFRKTSS